MHRNTGDGLAAKARGRDLQPRDGLAPAPRHEAHLPIMRVEGLAHELRLVVEQVPAVGLRHGLDGGERLGWTPVMTATREG